MRVRPLALAAASSAALVLTAVPAHGQGYQFTLVASPNGGNFDGLAFGGINDAGQVTGGITCRNTGKGCYGSGPSFVYEAGAFRYLSHAAGGINDAGVVVGTTSDAQGFHGLIDSAGVVRTFDGPDAPSTLAGAATGASGINNAGQVVGSEGNSRKGSDDHAYVYSNGAFTVFDTPFGGFTQAYDINNLGQVVGTYTTNGGLGSTGGYFRDADGTIRAFNAPGAISTVPIGLNDFGVVVGDVLYPGGLVGSVGFVYRDGVFTLLEAPGPGYLTASGVNNAGVIVGTYSALSGDVYGFIATPNAVTAAPEPGTLALSAAGLAALGAAARRRWVRSA